MMEHLGGPESPEKIVERQERYERLPGDGPGKMFKIVEAATGESVGSVGYWERELARRAGLRDRLVGAAASSRAAGSRRSRPRR